MQPQNNAPLKLRAYAKINLSLKVSGKRSDGYHDIDSVMQSISLHDEVELKPASSGITVHCTPHIEGNIAEKAAKTLLDGIKLVKGVEISIKKNIPVSSGLAGGSADAAAVLIGLNILFNLNLHMTKLIEVGANIGSDVPFCLTGGTARCKGKGEKVEKLNPSTGPAFLIVTPNILVPTKDIYDEFDRVGAGRGGNDLEKAAVSRFPRIAAVKETLNHATGAAWKMSGSGPAMFLELMDLSDAEKYMGTIAELRLNFHVVKRMDRGVDHEK